MTNNRHTIRNLDADLLLEARILAIQTGTTIGALINEGLEIVLTDGDDEGDFCEQDEIHD